MKRVINTEQGGPGNKPHNLPIYLVTHTFGSGPKIDKIMRGFNEKATNELETAGFRVFLPQSDEAWSRSFIPLAQMLSAELAIIVGDVCCETRMEIKRFLPMKKPIILWIPSKEVAIYYTTERLMADWVNAIVGPFKACEVMRNSVAVQPATRILELDDLSRMDFALRVLSSPAEFGFFSKAVGVL